MAEQPEGGDRRGDAGAGRVGERWCRAARGAGEPTLVMATDGADGELVLPAPEDAVEFVSLMVAPPEPAEAPGTGPVEIMVGAVTVRLELGASAERIAVVRALA